LETQEQIDLFVDFFNTYYRTQIAQAMVKDLGCLLVSFKDLLEFSPYLAEELLDNPKEIFKVAELAIANIDDKSALHFRICNLPNKEATRIRDLRSKHLAKLVIIEGYIRQKSDVRPIVVSTIYECQSCGDSLPRVHKDNIITKPVKCHCGYKGTFLVLKENKIDGQSMNIEEIQEALKGGEQPKRIHCFLREDLVSPLTDQHLNAGKKVVVVGVLTEVSKQVQGTKSTQLDIVIEVNSIMTVEEDFSEIDITEADTERIIAFSKREDLFPTLIGSVAPQVYGYPEIKEALVLQLFGGVKKFPGTRISRRGDIHIFLVGSPGTGKSQLLNSILQIAPKGRYVSGKSTSAAGLTGAVVKDEFTGSWGVEAGAMVLAHKGILVCDELDKMSSEDRSALHEGLESQRVTISKATVHVSLNCETTMLAAANPKLGRFDNFQPLAGQIDLPASLLNRFDLIFPLSDIAEEEKDTYLTKFILNLHSDGENKIDVDTNFIRKYIAYAKQTITPRLTQESKDTLENYYLRIRKSGKQEEGADNPIPISPRQLEALIRLSEASAKARLSSTVEPEDATRAIKLLQFFLGEFGVDPVTGKLDIDRISGETSFSQRNVLEKIKAIMKELANQYGNAIPITEIENKAVEKKILVKDLDDTLDKLKRAGDIYEPKRGFWRII